METQDKPELEEKPPFFNSWSGIYWFILIAELVLILIFSLISQFYGL